MPSPFDLTGKRALVTGANTGIGQGIAIALAAAGAEIVAVGRSPMDETGAAIAEIGGTMRPIKADLADPVTAAVMLGEVWDGIGPLDILVNNAGIVRRAPAEEFADADWDEVMALDLKTAFVLCREFGRRALAAQRSAKIINIASVLSFQGGMKVVSYAAAKHALTGVTKALANEWAARSINVNAIAPGYCITNITEPLRNDEERYSAILARIPAGRWGTPEEIGGAAVFLASPAADYVHGVVLPVDGGWLAR
jgi:2-deoxy-D-gluconate 3-dehydrogenase